MSDKTLQVSSIGNGPQLGNVVPAGGEQHRAARRKLQGQQVLGVRSEKSDGHGIVLHVTNQVP